MSIQTKVPDEDMCKEYVIEFEKATTQEEVLEVVTNYQHKIWKDNV